MQPGPGWPGRRRAGWPAERGQHACYKSAYDAHGRELQITRDNALNDGFAADVEPGSCRMLEIDPIIERGHVIRATHSAAPTSLRRRAGKPATGAGWRDWNVWWRCGSETGRLSLFVASARSVIVLSLTLRFQPTQNPGTCAVSRQDAITEIPMAQGLCVSRRCGSGSPHWALPSKA